MSKQHIMLDIETAATDSNAAILSIGACRFSEAGIDDTFHIGIKTKDSQREGFSVDIETLLWWMDQTKEAQDSWRRLENRTTVAGALHEFSRWVNLRNLPACMWGNGSDFDCVVLGNAYSRMSIGRPWSYSRNRCYRTIKNMATDIKMQRVGTHHSAVDDAVSQAEHLITILERKEWELA